MKTLWLRCLLAILALAVEGLTASFTPGSTIPTNPPLGRAAWSQLGRDFFSARVINNLASQQAGDVEFTGTVVDTPHGALGADVWAVDVNQVLSGPSISGSINVILLANTQVCRGSYDFPAMGDTVQVFGYYDGAAEQVCGDRSDTYYIKILPGSAASATQTPVETATPAPGNQVPAPSHSDMIFLPVLFYAR